jgi:hypothetical protein
MEIKNDLIGEDVPFPKLGGICHDLLPVVCKKPALLLF